MPIAAHLSLQLAGVDRPVGAMMRTVFGPATSRVENGRNGLVVDPGAALLAVVDITTPTDTTCASSSPRHEPLTNAQAANKTRAERGRHLPHDFTWARGPLLLSLPTYPALLATTMALRPTSILFALSLVFTFLWQAPLTAAVKFDLHVSPEPCTSPCLSLSSSSPAR